MPLPSRVGLNHRVPSMNTVQASPAVDLTPPVSIPSLPPSQGAMQGSGLPLHIRERLSAIQPNRKRQNIRFN